MTGDSNGNAINIPTPPNVASYPTLVNDLANLYQATFGPGVVLANNNNSNTAASNSAPVATSTTASGGGYTAPAPAPAPAPAARAGASAAGSVQSYGSISRGAAAVVPPSKSPRSPVEQDWDRQKTQEGAYNPALDKLMNLGALESVKEKVLEIKAQIDLFRRQGLFVTKEARLHCAVLGNPGTGKTTVARLYGGFLYQSGALRGCSFVETTGSRLASEGVKAAQTMIDNLLVKAGGTLFIDEAYQLTTSGGGGTQVLDFLLAEIEN